MSTATEMLAFYLDAEREVLLGQSVSKDGRQLTLADLEEIRIGRAEWERKVSAEQAAAQGRASYALADFRCRR